MFVFTTYMFEVLVLGVLHLDNRLSSFVFALIVLAQTNSK